MSLREVKSCTIRIRDLAHCKTGNSKSKDSHIFITSTDNHQQSKIGEKQSLILETFVLYKF